MFETLAMVLQIAMKHCFVRKASDGIITQSRGLRPGGLAGQFLRKDASSLFASCWRAFVFSGLFARRCLAMCSSVDFRPSPGYEWRASPAAT